MTQILVPPLAGCALLELVYAFPPLPIGDWAMRMNICFLLILDSVPSDVMKITVNSVVYLE